MHNATHNFGTQTVVTLDRDSLMRVGFGDACTRGDVVEERGPPALASASTPRANALRISHCSTTGYTADGPGDCEKPKVPSDYTYLH